MMTFEEVIDLFWTSLFRCEILPLSVAVSGERHRLCLLSVTHDHLAICTRPEEKKEEHGTKTGISYRKIDPFPLPQFVWIERDGFQRRLSVGQVRNGRAAA
jgi:hypothetical protein